MALLIWLCTDPCDRFVMAMASKIGLRPGTIRSTHTTREREDAQQEFTNPDSDMDIFVLNMAVNVAGLNLQHCCHKGYITQFTWNVATLLQAMGRITRVGQKQEVEWRILRVNSSYYDVQEDKMCQKFAEVVRNEAHMPDYLGHSPELQRIVAYEQIRVLLAQPFNRYTWCAPSQDPPGIIQEYNCLRHRHLGRFYSRIAQLLIAMPRQYRSERHMLNLGYYMGHIAKKFGEEIKKKEVDVSFEWVLEHLQDAMAEAREELSSTTLASHSRRGRSKKYKSVEIIGDEDESGDEEGLDIDNSDEAAARLQEKARRFAERRKTAEEAHANGQTAALASISDYKALAKALVDPRAIHKGDEAAARRAGRPLGRINPTGVTRKQDAEARRAEARLAELGAGLAGPADDDIYD